VPLLLRFTKKLCKFGVQISLPFAYGVKQKKPHKDHEGDGKGAECAREKVILKSLTQK